MEINVKRLIKDLANPDDDLRALSAMTLMKVDLPERKAREEALVALMKATGDKNVSVRFFSRKAIDKLKRSIQEEGRVETMLSLEECLSSSEYEDRLSAVLQITRENRVDFKERLLELLTVEKHDFVKASLISCLKKMLDKSEAHLLSPFLSDSDNRVRSNTIEALEFLKAEESIPGLFSALEDNDNRIRSVAAKALQSFGEEKVFFVLKTMLNSNEEWMKGSAIYALSHINAVESITLLIDAAKTAPQPETRVKAIISLANYQDSSSYGFLKHAALTGEGPLKDAAVRALKLFEEKFGAEPPAETLLGKPAAAEAPEKEACDNTSAAQAGDLAGTVSRFFRKGRDEAVGLSKKAAISYALTDLEKELIEMKKEIGRITFEIYQQGELEHSELLTIGHEILRMNYFIQKYSDDEELKNKQKNQAGFFTQLKNIFSKAKIASSNVSQAEKFLKKKDELILKLGDTAYLHYLTGNFSAESLEAYFQSCQALEKKVVKEKQRSNF